MARLVVQHDVDPAIGVVLEEVLDEADKAAGYHGICTECGWVIHRWFREHAVGDAKRHVDSHEASVIGIDPGSVVPGQTISQGPVQVRAVRGTDGDVELLIGCNID